MYLINITPIKGFCRRVEVLSIEFTHKHTICGHTIPLVLNSIIEGAIIALLRTITP